jgi:hypothetical protein
MRTITLFVLLFLIPTLVFAQECERETDEFTGNTTIYCLEKDFEIEQQPDETILFRSLAYMCGEKSMIFSLTTRSESWNFLDTDTGYALIDGERVQFEGYKTNPKVDGGEFVEQYNFSIDQNDLRQIAGAKTFRFKFGKAVFNLSSTIDEARALLETL